MLANVREAGGRYSSEPFDAVWQIDEDSSDACGTRDKSNSAVVPVWWSKTCCLLPSAPQSTGSAGREISILNFSVNVGRRKT